ncbi:MAG: AAA family ATPase, partial [Lachnospiraceae bacterium]|nr:AAA family ATPase [Lachnospiraceae bacterium]
MGRNVKIPQFQMAVPDVHTIYVGTGAKQRAKYIQLPSGFGKQMLDHDIKEGAAIYAGFTESLERKPAQYNIITAPTEEDGLRAVSYIAGIYADGDGFRNDAVFDAFTDEEFQAEFDPEDPLEELFQELTANEDGDDPDEFEDDHGYYECFDRIPIIEMSEVAGLEADSINYRNYGSYCLETESNEKPPERWWLSCQRESVCILCRKSELDELCDYDELITRFEIKSLKRFSGNRHIYVLVVNDHIEDRDFSITSCILEYTANSFRVDSSRAKLESYYRNLLRYEANSHGFAFSKSLDVAMLADKLSKIDEQHPCEQFKKIMEYMIYLDAPYMLKPNDFESIGLKTLVEKTNGNREETLENELVGMEDVKKQITGIVNMLRYVKLQAKRNVKTEYHNVHLFIGAPGTAKTTVAKIMAKMMQNEGLISGSRFISISGAQLKGAYVGQTAPKIHAIFEQYDAIFIDEAYSLTSSGPADGMDSYAQEALAQLAIELEEHATNKLVIFAGYGGKNVSAKNNLMYDFLKANPGISSRINSTVYFDSYTADDMVRIIHALAAKKSLKIQKRQDQMIADYFESRRKENDFGNGREARVFLEHCERQIAARIAFKDPDELTA